MPRALLNLILLSPLLICDATNGAELAQLDINDPEFIASSVYLGGDREMPLSGEFFLSIQPDISSTGKPTIPTSIGAALQSMHRALPHWYLNALKQSNNDTECYVSVNGRSYTFPIDYWMWLNWVKPSDSPIRRELERAGVQIFTPSHIAGALGIGVCQIVKTNNEQHSVEYVISMARARPF